MCYSVKRPDIGEEIERTIYESPEIFHFLYLFERGSAVANCIQNFFPKPPDDVWMLR